MKALIRKEIRENSKVAGIGFGLAVLLLLLTWQARTLLMRNLSVGRASSGDYDLLQPLTAELFVLGVSWFCAVFAGLLGWLQIHNERHRDLWAFLVHRPLSRTGIFLAKVSAGVALYCAGTGLPLLGFVLWVRFSGLVAAPFEWSMVLPAASGFLTGLVFYFAGMLTGLREARWYASRGLPLLAALAVAVAAADLWTFWQAALLILGGTALIGTAVWGGFHSHGFYRGQPATAKLAAAGTVTTGAYMFGTFLGSVLLAVYVMSASFSWSSYCVAKDGTIYRVKGQRGGPSEVTDLNGRPVLDPVTGHKVEVMEHNRTAPSISLHPDFGDQARFWENYRQRSHFYLAWRVTPDTVWYFWRTYGRVVGFDRVSRRLLGSLGPDGFAPGSPQGKARFVDIIGDKSAARTDTTVYRIDVERRAVKSLFTATADDPIGAAGEFEREAYNWQYLFVVTRRAAHLLTPEGKPIWTQPCEPLATQCNLVQVYILEPDGHFELWTVPAERSNTGKGAEQPIQVVWLSQAQGATKSVGLSRIGEGRRFSWAQCVLDNVFRPAVATQPAASSDGAIDWRALGVSLAVGMLLCAPLAWWVARRYSMSLGPRLAWAVFMVVGGFPGLLAFLSVNEWPGRVSCPNCGKLRVVDREHCEHCGAAFTPPETIGTEIFEPVDSNAGALAASA